MASFILSDRKERRSFSDVTVRCAAAGDILESTALKRDLIPSTEDLSAASAFSESCPTRISNIESLSY